MPLQNQTSGFPYLHSIVQDTPRGLGDANQNLDSETKDDSTITMITGVWTGPTICSRDGNTSTLKFFITGLYIVHAKHHSFEFPECAHEGKLRRSAE